MHDLVECFGDAVEDLDSDLKRWLLCTAFLDVDVELRLRRVEKPSRSRPISTTSASFCDALRSQLAFLVHDCSLLFAIMYALRLLGGVSPTHSREEAYTYRTSFVHGLGGLKAGRSKDVCESTCRHLQDGDKHTAARWVTRAQIRLWDESSR